MTRPLRRVAIVVLILFGALFVNLNYLQVLRADDLANDNRNTRGLIAEYAVERGSIVAGDGQDAEEIATVVETDGRLRYQRVYPDGPLYAHLTGYHSFVFGRAGIESAFNDFLTGGSAEAFGRNLADLLAGRERQGDDVVTTIRPAVQRAARDALGDQLGAVVALNPRDGEILALWSYPSYEPTELSLHDGAAVRAAWDRLEEDPTRPRLNRALREWYPPGSTFKVVTAAAALETGIATPDRIFPDPQRQELPLTTASIGNFGGGLCNAGQPLNLVRAMAVSCNTTFAQLGLDLGSAELAAQAERFGMNMEWASQLPVLTSRIPADMDPPSTAQSAIGQRDVRVTPLQMAMIIAGIANDGVVMTPRVVKRVEDAAGRVLREYPPSPLPGGGQAVRPETAHLLRDMMVGVVQSGTGRRAAIEGVTVAGKTGTAQHGEGPPTVWFSAFAPAEDPRVAVAVVVEAGGGVGDEATGGAIAAPIARAVIEAALAAE
jgi:penicillin-binding protein A